MGRLHNAFRRTNRERGLNLFLEFTRSPEPRIKCFRGRSVVLDITFNPHGVICMDKGTYGVDFFGANEVEIQRAVEAVKEFMYH